MGSIVNEPVAYSSEEPDPINRASYGSVRPAFWQQYSSFAMQQDNWIVEPGDLVSNSGGILTSEWLGLRARPRGNRHLPAVRPVISRSPLK
jgi:hypothetical protein